MAAAGGARPAISHSSRFVKRSLDIAGSAVGLVLLAPLLAATALAILIDSGRPILFRQSRAGRDGAEFCMLKFRSMVVGAESRREALVHLSESEGVFKLGDDPRMTRVGRVIRRLSIDELPQLVNVLRGQMSLVGPRPLPLVEDRLIEGHSRHRLDLRPGITGPWQLMGPRRAPLHLMVELDNRYVEGWSLRNDLRILLLTIPHVLGRRGI